jgi:hypothetical protein
MPPAVRDPFTAILSGNTLRNGSSAGKPMKLYGRDDEQIQLQRSFERMCQKSQQEWVLIGGAAGTGANL